MADNLSNDDYYFDYDTYLETDIIKISEEGINLSDGKTISFAECIKNYAKYNETKGYPIIGEREITGLSFTLYSSPKIVMIKFIKKPWINELFSTSAVYRFMNLQKQINSFGFDTFDLS